MHLVLLGLAEAGWGCLHCNALKMLGWTEHGVCPGLMGSALLGWAQLDFGWECLGWVGNALGRPENCLG